MKDPSHVTACVSLSPAQPPPPAPAPANSAAPSPNKKSSRLRRSRSLRRGTAEIQTAWLPDPQYQRETVESTQASLDQDFNSLYNLLKVQEKKTHTQSHRRRNLFEDENG